MKLPNPFVDSERKLRNGWWIVVFFVVLGALLIPTVVMSGGPQAVPMTVQAGLVLLASVLCQVLRRQPLHELTGRFELRWISHLAAGIALGALLMLLPALLLYVFGLVQWQRSAMGLSGFGAALLLFASVAVAEELLFRGFMFQRMIDGLGVWPAQLLMAAYFLLNHASAVEAAGGVKLMAGANIFIASLAFGFAYLRTRSLALPIGLHFAANVMQGTVLGFGVSGDSGGGLLDPILLDGRELLTGGPFGLEASLPGLLFISATALLLCRWQPAINAVRSTGEMGTRNGDGGN